MYIEKINFLDIVKHDVAKTKILEKLEDKCLTEYDIRYINDIIHCDTGHVSYKVILKDECFTIFEDGTDIQ